MVAARSRAAVEFAIAGAAAALIWKPDMRRQLPLATLEWD